MQRPNGGGGWSDREVGLAGTIADLVGSGDELPKQIAEGIQYRSLDRQLYLEV